VVCHLKDTVLGLAVAYKFNSKYSLILYEILQRHAARKNLPWEWRVKIEDLRRLLSVEDKFKNYSDLDKRVLHPAQREINSHADFLVDYHSQRAGKCNSMQGRGAKVIEIIFKVRRKALEEVKKEAALNIGARSKADNDSVHKALLFLQDAPVSKRLYWIDYAKSRGIKAPANTSKNYMPDWVPTIAEKICQEEKL
jgi:plasmid replication initiation protein